MNEIQKMHFGYGFPFLVYTHALDFFEQVPNHNINIDSAILAFDMCDSLRRRHVALSHAVLPKTIKELSVSLERPLIIKNLGSGAGLDVLNAAIQSDGRIGKVLNYDTNLEAIKLGKMVTQYLEQKEYIREGVIEYIPQSLIKSNESADVIIKIGVICGLQDNVATILLAQDYTQLNKGGKLIVSSSNIHMQSTDPLASFLIQHIGTRDDPFKGWGLNCRTEGKLKEILESAGFKKIEIHHDAQFPGKETLSPEILYGVDPLPAVAAKFVHSGKPIALPPQETLDKKIGYNWIAIATK